MLFVIVRKLRWMETSPQTRSHDTTTPWNHGNVFMKMLQSSQWCFMIERPGSLIFEADRTLRSAFEKENAKTNKANLGSTGKIRYIRYILSSFIAMFNTKTITYFCWKWQFNFRITVFRFVLMFQYYTVSRNAVSWHYGLESEAGTLREWKSHIHFISLRSWKQTRRDLSAFSVVKH